MMVRAITAIINFLITSLVIFLLVRGLNVASEKVTARFKKEQEEAAPTEKECPYCMSKISIKATRCPNCTSQLPMEEDSIEEAPISE